MQPASAALDNATDEALAGRVCQGDKRAFAILYKRYFDDVYRFALSRSYDWNQEDAMDIAAQTFEKCLDVIGTFRGRSSFKTWLFGIAKNCSLLFYGHRDRKHQTVFIDNARRDGGGTLPIPDRGPTPQETYAAESEKRLLWDLIHRLEGPYREVVLLRCIQGFSSEETAKLMKRSNGSVRVLLARAIRQMRTEYEKKGEP